MNYLNRAIRDKLDLEWHVDPSNSTGGKLDFKVNGFEVTLPKFPKKLCYVKTHGRVEVGKSDNLILSYNITATPNFEIDFKTEKHNTCDTPPSFRPFLINNLSGEHGRWWPIVGIPLTPSNGKFVIEMNPTLWQSVNGKRADYSNITLKHWHSALRLPVQLALCFGGGCYFGHGVRMVKGNMNVNIKSFTI